PSVVQSSEARQFSETVFVMESIVDGIDRNPNRRASLRRTAGAAVLTWLVTGRERHERDARAYIRFNYRAPTSFLL
ncbi:MAG: hypothetical protein ACRD4I_14200, partial [Candidatus Angelobacter sp.]